ncbi:MAG: tripartite tricarboxylate transporter substrate binding protein [Burkholderiales bacterium]
MNLPIRHGMIHGLLGACLLAAAWGAAAQNYPVRPVKIIVPSAAGGGTDSTTRIITPKLDEFLGQRVVVENRAGAASLIGSEMVARAAPDGYTLLTGISTITIHPSMQKKMAFDTMRDFAPVSQFVILPNVLVGHPTLKPKTVKELIAFAKARPGQLEFASAGTGSNLHLCMEMFLGMTGLKMVHVPYKGSGQAIADLAAGYVPFMITNMITGTQQVRAGRLHAYGVTGARRSAAAPDIPTIAEQGVAGYEAVQWYGLMAPAGTPPDIVAKLHKGVVFALQDAGVRKRFANSGAEPVGNTPEEFAAVMRNDMAKWAKVVKAAGLSPK